MVTVVCEGNQVRVPPWVIDLASFRRWADTDDCPEKGSVHYLRGEVWIDLTREPIFTHVALKGEIASGLYGLVKARRLGLLLGAGATFSNAAADISCRPDGAFLSAAGLAAGRARLVEGKDGPDELEGSPDMVLEVVSTSSVTKDTIVLKQAYWEAGVREYWLVDARGEALAFDILRHTARGYRATPGKDGWLKSAVFGRSFRLARHAGAAGHPDYTLDVR
jgi:Uma2 family endonuclease